MKRQNENVPKFDEIIFEDRNKTYGAYNLRKSYNSTASISILSALFLCIALVLVLFLTTEESTAYEPDGVDIVATFDDFHPEVIVQPETKQPAAIIKALQNITPEVITDTGELTSYVPINDDLYDFETNGDVNDTLTVIKLPEEIVPHEEQIFISVKEPPEYPGGNSELMRYINENITYPDKAIENNIQGRVTLKFVVNTDGSVDRIEVIGSVDPSLDNEAVRVVSSLPRFRPGKQDGVPVRVWFFLPVVFHIDNR